jgi:phosphoribosylaminoimidazole carboxylase PurE protein
MPDSENTKKPSLTPKIAVVLGSKSDLPVAEDALLIFEEFDVAFDFEVLSAHRTPDAVRTFVQSFEKKGGRVFIAVAGAAAHLAGVIASHTLLPVIGVPVPSSALNGLDALLSTVQMPGGIPVATMAVGKAGMKNAVYFALQILATEDPFLKEALIRFRREMAEKVLKDGETLKKSLEEKRHPSS